MESSKPKTIPKLDIINEVESYSKDNKQHQQSHSHSHDAGPQHHVEILLKDSSAKPTTRRKDGRKSGDNKSVYRILFKRIRDILDGNKAKSDDEPELEDLPIPQRYYPDSLNDLCKATRFSEDEIKRIYRGFKAECPTGFVREETFKCIYSQFFPLGASSGQYAHYVFNSLDPNRNGSLSFEDFVINLSILLRGSIDEKLNWTFSLYDINGDGCITRGEMTDIVTAIYELMGRIPEGCEEEQQIKDKVERIFEKIHREKFEEFNKEMMSTPTPPSKKLKRDPRCFKKLAVMLVVENVLPFSFIDSKSFKDFISAVSKTITLPCSKTLEKHTSEIYAEMKQNLIEILEDIEFLCATADLLVAFKKTYLAVTVHWIDTKNLTRKSAAISCKYIPEQPTRDVIEEKLYLLFLEFGIEHKILAIVTNNASNFEVAFNVHTNNDSDEDDVFSEAADIVLESIDLAEMSLNSSVLPEFRRCAAHTLNLIATKDTANALSNDSYQLLHNNLQEKLKRLWLMHHNEERSGGMLRKYFSKYFKCPDATNWSSFYTGMKEIAAQPLEELNVALLELGEKQQIFEIEYKFIKEYITIMKPVEDALKIIQGELHIYMGNYTPTIKRLEYVLEGINKLEICQPLKEAVLDGIQKRFTDINDSINIKASILHPFHKSRSFEYSTSSKKDRIIKLLAEELAGDGHGETLTTFTVKKELTEFEKFFNYSECITLPSKEQILIEKFVEHKNDSLNIFLSVENGFHKLKQMFIKYNTVITTAAATEKLYDILKDYLRLRRSEISAELFEECVLLNRNKEYV